MFGAFALVCSAQDRLLVNEAEPCDSERLAVSSSGRRMPVRGVQIPWRKAIWSGFRWGVSRAAIPFHWKCRPFQVANLQLEGELLGNGNGACRALE